MFESMPLIRKRIRVGDVLTLKSGGVPMTAVYVGPVVFAPGVWVTCQWCDEHGEIQQGMFPQSALVRGARRGEGRGTVLRRLAAAVRRWLALRAAAKSA